MVQIKQTEMAKCLAILEKTPACFARNTQSLSEAQLVYKIAEDRWSLKDTLAHLRACEEIWSFAIYASLTRKDPQLPEIHPTKDWMKHLVFEDLSLQTTLELFALRRQALLSILKKLTVQDWAKGAFLDKRYYSVYQLARRMALHEEKYCQQIEKLSKKVSN